MMTKIGKPVLESSNFSPPSKLQMSPVQAIRPSPPSSPTNSETCEVKFAFDKISHLQIRKC